MDSKDKQRMTDFGFEQIPESQKQGQVKEVFDEVAPKYDLMNDVLSFGLHRLWKARTIAEARIEPGWKILDIAGGTGDMAIGMAKKLNGQGEVLLTDINEEMLNIGRKRVLAERLPVKTMICDAEHLPFENESFDLVTVAFGLRNMTHKEAALSEMARVLKKGSKLMVLEFSKPDGWLAPFYDLYSFKLMPWLAAKVTGHAENYRYLAESIRMHPDQATLAKIMRQSGFDTVTWRNFTFGITALHIGVKSE